MKRRWLGNVTLIPLGIIVALALGEIILRVIGFSFHLYPERVEFGWPDPVVMEQHFMPDKDLLWVPTNYQDKLQAYHANPPDVIFMGCSCTQYGRYDEHFKALIDENYPGNHFSFGNVGVGGWSSYEGRQQLERDVVPIKPSVVTIFYGWNDHWIGFGIQDKDVARVGRSVLYKLRGLRLAQLVSKALVVIMHDDVPAEHPRRVSPEDFRKNLTEMVRIARANDIIPVLLTAPTSQTKGNEPPYLLERHLLDLNELIPLHQQYVNIVREVAKNEGVVLADLAKEFEALEPARVRMVYFFEDGVHLRDTGNRMIAKFLYECFEENGLLEVIVPGT